MERRTVLEMLKLLAPRAGFEPATIRLTVECSTAELPRNKAKRCSLAVRITKPFGLAKDELVPDRIFRAPCICAQTPCCVLTDLVPKMPRLFAYSRQMSARSGVRSCPVFRP